MIYHQRFRNSVIVQITAFEQAHEPSFTRPRNTTYDRFLLFRCKKKKYEKLESFHYGLKTLSGKCRLGTTEEDLMKDIFIAFMSNTDIQGELLMETRNPLQVLQFALNLERGQWNQKAINTQLNRTTTIPLNQLSYIQRNQTPSQTPRWRIPTRNPQPQRNAILPNPCILCGLQFTPKQVCPTKRVQCNLCKKVEHYSKVGRSAKFLWQTQQITPQQNLPQTRRVRKVRATTNTKSLPNTSQAAQLDKNDEPIDLENIFFIQEIFDNWSTVNFLKPKSFNIENPAEHSPKLSDKI